MPRSCTSVGIQKLSTLLIMARRKSAKASAHTRQSRKTSASRYRWPSILLGRTLIGKARLDQRTFLFAEPASVAWTVGQGGEHDQAERQRRKGFEEEKPLPTPQSGVAVQKLQDQARKRRTDALASGMAMMNSATACALRRAGNQ